MRSLLFSAIAATALALHASPVVENVAVSLSLPNSVEVEYDLSGSEPAVITLAAATNGVPVCGSRLVSLTGDVCRKILPGTGRKIHWAIGKDWPGADIEDGLTVTVQAWPLTSPPPYMAVDLMTRSNIFFYASSESVYGGVTNRMYKTKMMLMRRIPAEEILWRMGSPSSEADRKTDGSETAHLVTLSADYYISVYELTQFQWRIFNSGKTFNFSGDGTLPAESFSWTNLRGRRADGYSWPQDGHLVDTSLVLGKIRAMTGLELDLPTEAQWEYACRAGSPAAYANDAESIGELGWHSGITNRTVEVGMKAPNEWGLYDMHGNVWEMCLDWYQEMSSEAVRDPQGPEVDPGTSYDVNSFVIRGGAYNSASADCRNARRRNFTAKDYHASFGCRLACPVEIWQ